MVDARQSEATGIEHLGGVGAELATALRALLQCETRSVNLAYLQRGGAPTPFDRVLATTLGVAAFDAVVAGRSGLFAAIRGDEVVLEPLATARSEPGGSLSRTRRSARHGRSGSTSAMSHDHDIPPHDGFIVRPRRPFVTAP